MKADIANLNEEQKKQVNLQWRLQQHNRQEIDIPLGPCGESLNGFVIHQHVWNPTITTSMYLANFLFHNNGLFYNKKTLDMGTGTGLMGIIMSLQGANDVTVTDISPFAIYNTQENVQKFKIKNMTIKYGNLFENINDLYDVIVFNHPYFLGNPNSQDTIAGSMMDNGDLIQKFFQECPTYLSEEGIIVMPSYSKANIENNPEEQSKKNGYNVEKAFILNAKMGLQLGDIEIDLLRKNLQK